MKGLTDRKMMTEHINNGTDLVA